MISAGHVSAVGHLGVRLPATTSSSSAGYPVLVTFQRISAVGTKEKFSVPSPTFQPHGLPSRPCWAHQRRWSPSSSTTSHTFLRLAQLSALGTSGPCDTLEFHPQLHQESQNKGDKGSSSRVWTDPFLVVVAAEEFGFEFVGCACYQGQGVGELVDVEVHQWQGVADHYVLADDGGAA
jgi:hypothetical protein